MASIQIESSSLLNRSSVAETSLATRQRAWRRPALVVASVAVLSMLVAFCTVRNSVSGNSTSADIQPLILMQDLRMLSDDHYLPYDSGKSKQDNMHLAFEHLVATALSNELAADEKAIFEQHFKGAMSAKYKGHSKPNALQWKVWLKDAFEGTKPEITDSMVKKINSENLGFTVRKRSWMKDLTHDDVKSRLGFIQPPGPAPAPKFLAMNSLPEKKEFHAHVTWPQCAEVVRRDHNQGQCGSCWAFAAMSVLDSRLCIKTGGQFKGTAGHLSRTYATSCSYDSRDGCQGGWMSEVFELASSHGIPTGGTEGCLPYFAHGEGTDHFDNQQVAPPCPHACVKPGYGRTLSADKFKLGGKGTWMNQDPIERTSNQRVKAVMQEIMKEGPVAAAVFVDSAFQAYSSGIFKSSCHKAGANHAVTAIGFGGNNCPNGYGNCPAFYWELLNSWGNHWGNNGEIKVAACVATTFQWPAPITNTHVQGLPTPLFPGSGPTPAPAFEVTSGSCTVDGGNCVLSPNWPSYYGDNHKCNINVKNPNGAKLQVVDFLLESGYDFLTVNHKKYSGSTGPMDTVAKGNIEWSSDYSVKKTGWKICEEPQITDVTCDTVGDEVAKPEGETATVKCPSGCGRMTIWGSNPYTTDSGLCRAAVHAGLSGRITVKFVGKKSNFKGTLKNGVNTISYGGQWTAMQLSS